MQTTVLYRLGLLMVRLRWAVIALWVLLFVSSAPLVLRLPAVLTSGFGATDTEAQRGLALLAQELGSGKSSLTVVFHSNQADLTVQEHAYALAVTEALEPFAPGRMPHVTGVVSYFNSHHPTLVSLDGRTTYATVLLDVPPDEALDLVPLVRKDLKAEGLETYVTGGVPIFYDLNTVIEQDARRTETVAFPLVLIALLLVFGSAVAAGLPVLIGAFSVLISLALVYLLTFTTSMSIFVLNIAVFLGLGLAIDYALLVVTRFREELGHRSVEEAVGTTLATAGRALLFSALTSIIGLSGLLFFDFTMLRSVGIGGIAVISISLLLALTLVPALLGVLGHRLNALALPWARPRRPREGMWRRIATLVMRHPLPFIGLLVPVLLLLGTPFLRVNLNAPWADALPARVESRRGWDIVAQEMGPGELAPVLLAVQSAGPMLAPDHIGALYDLVHPFATDPRVQRVESIVTLDPRLGREAYQHLYEGANTALPPAAQAALAELTRDDFTLVQIVPRYPPMAPETQALVRDLRDASREAALRVLVTGATADLMDATQAMYQAFPKAVAYILVATYLTLLVLFRSVLLPLKAVVMNLLSIFASYGALVVIFQEGFLSGLLGFTPSGSIDSALPILMFMILFGVSMDYEVFLLTRVKEEYDRTGDNTGSVAAGMERTGQVITSAALILVLVAGGMVTSEAVPLKAVGLGMAIAIFLDASVVRALLVPALMRVLGDWNWWAPAFIRGRQPAPDAEKLAP